jgi:hypothetical protein
MALGKCKQKNHGQTHNTYYLVNAIAQNALVHMFRNYTDAKHTYI